mgnify:CR=1 FL=1
MSLLLLGFMIGIRHALEADHVAALASIAASNDCPKQVWKQGAVWGLGHTLTLFVFGSIVVGLEVVLPETLAQGLEAVVGVMLVILGADVMRRLISARSRSPWLYRGGGSKLPPQGSLNETRRTTNGFPLRALLVGMVHGMAGAAALILLTLSTVDSLVLALIYMLLFGFGSIFGMTFLSIVIALPLRACAHRAAWAHTSLQITIGLASVLFGLLLIYEAGVGRSLG